MRYFSKISFTKEGFENLKKDYQKLLDARPEAVKNLKEARDMGDLSENSLYRGCRARLSSIDSNLRRLNGLIKLADVVEKAPAGIVGIGSKVRVNDGSKEETFHIVGRFEADPKNHKISVISPVGQALICKRVGDSVTVNTPKGKITYKVIELK